MQVLDEVAPSAPPLHPNNNNASIRFSLLDSAPDVTDNFLTIDNNLNTKIATDCHTVPASKKGDLKKGPVKRKVTISKANVKKLTKPAPKSGKMLEIINELFEEESRSMDHIPSSTETATVPTADKETTPVLHDDRGQICQSDWELIIQMACENQAAKMCSITEFDPKPTFDEKENPLIRIILQNLPSINCYKCLDDNSALTNRGRDKCGTFRLKCGKCTSTGSIRAYANTVPVDAIKAVLSSLSDLSEQKKALKWCNLLLEKAEAIDFETEELSIEDLKEEVALLRLELAAARAEVRRLTAPAVNVKRTFLEAATTNPTFSQKAKPMLVKVYDHQKKTLTEVTKFKPAPTPSTPRPSMKPVSDMELVFFKGADGDSPSNLRQMLTNNGFDGHLVKDVTYLTEDVVQVLTYTDKVGLLTEAIKKCKPKTRRAENFDPTDPKSYDLKTVATKENVSLAYFAAVDQSVQRLKKCIATAPSLQRSMNFLARVVESRDFKYASAPLPPKAATSPPKFVSFFEKALARSATGPAADVNMNPAVNAQ